MKRMACWMLVMVWGATAALAQMNVLEDPSAEEALLTWHDPVPWQAGVVLARGSRPVDLEGLEWDLRSHSADVAVGVSPWEWLLLYGQAGVSEARLDGVMPSDYDVGPGGLLGARLNLWQIYQGVQETSWRLTLQLAGQYAYRTTEDDDRGDLQWGETLVMLPIHYHLSFVRIFRDFFSAEIQSLAVYVGPAFSKVDGTWTRAGIEQDFEETQTYGVVGGVELWLLENVSFGVRADWFDQTSMQLTARYLF